MPADHDIVELTFPDVGGNRVGKPFDRSATAGRAVTRKRDCAGIWECGNLRVEDIGKAAGAMDEQQVHEDSTAGPAVSMRSIKRGTGTLPERAAHAVLICAPNKKIDAIR